MDKKQDNLILSLINLLNIMAYVAFGLATIFVLVFQFTGLPIFVTLALVVYTVGFLIIFSEAVIKCKEIFEKTRGVIVKVPEKTDDDHEVVNVKSEKTWAVVKAVASGLFAIFTFVVLLLF